MQLKSRDDVSAAVNSARVGVAGFSASDDPTDAVLACCAPVAAMHADFSAIPIGTLIMLAMQLLPILFPDGSGGEWIQKLQAILQLIASIFTN